MLNIHIYTPNVENDLDTNVTFLYNKFNSFLIT